MIYDESDGFGGTPSNKRNMKMTKATAEPNDKERAPYQAALARTAWNEVSMIVMYAACPLLIILELQKHVS
jgi:hypothetical protein